MLKKIGTKLLLSYMILLIIAFSISSITYNLLSRRYVINETKKQLYSEGLAIASLLTNVPLNDNSIKNKLAGRVVVKAAQRFVQADMLIMNKESEIIYISVENFEKKTAIRLARAGTTAPRGFVAEQIAINDRNGLIKGYIILFAKLENVYSLNRLMRGTELISMLVAGFAALIISLFFEKSLVNPIVELTRKIESYSKTKKLDVNIIKTGDEIQQLDEGFICLTNSLERYDKLQLNFLQNTSHELKTPLMSIQGYAEAIKDGVITGVAMEEGLDVIIDQSQKMKMIVDELIFLTRIENLDETIYKETVNLHELVYSAYQCIKITTEERNVTFELGIDKNIYVFCDRNKMQRALLNLFSNGVRYADKRIRVYSEHQKSLIKIFIEDDGIGFKQKEETKIFERFYKGDRGNTGLGLAIVKAIVEAHGGEIEAYNGKLKGAVFELWLPQI